MPSTEIFSTLRHSGDVGACDGANIFPHKTVRADLQRMPRGLGLAIAAAAAGGLWLAMVVAIRGLLA